jgi:uncharacterized protein with HEPN domain
MSLRSVVDYLEHIADAIERIGRHTVGLSESAFYQSEIAQDAVIRNIDIIGEACNNIVRRFPGFASGHPES